MGLSCPSDRELGEYPFQNARHDTYRDTENHSNELKCEKVIVLGPRQILGEKRELGERGGTKRNHAQSPADLCNSAQSCKKIAFQKTCEHEHWKKRVRQDKDNQLRMLK